MRMAEGCKVPRDEFLKPVSRPANSTPTGSTGWRHLPGKAWKLFTAKPLRGCRGKVRGADFAVVATDAGLPISGVPPRLYAR